MFFDDGVRGSLMCLLDHSDVDGGKGAGAVDLVSCHVDWRSLPGGFACVYLCIVRGEKVAVSQLTRAQCWPHLKMLDAGTLSRMHGQSVVHDMICIESSLTY